MSTKKEIIIVLAICMVLSTAGLIIASIRANTDDGAKSVIRVFGESGAEFKMLTVNGWVNVDRDFTSREQCQEYFEQRVRKLFAQAGVPAVTAKSENGFHIIRAFGIIDDHLQATATFQFPASTNQNLHIKPSLIISLESSDRNIPYRKLHRIVDSFLDDGNSHKSSVISGYYSGIVPRKRAYEILEKSLHKLGAEGLETTEDERMVSVAGYSPEVSKVLTYREKSVNINMALRYNYVEKQTFLYVGSPLITSEY